MNCPYEGKRYAKCRLRLRIGARFGAQVRNAESLPHERPALRKASVGGPPALRPSVLCRGAIYCAQIKRERGFLNIHSFNLLNRKVFDTYIDDILK
jgi:hypothetical protein